MIRNDKPAAIRVPDRLLDYDDDLIYTYMGNRFTGIGFEDMPGHGLSEISYVDGRQEGPARDWYPSGQLRSEAIYKSNTRHGPSREFREDGSVSSETFYEYGILVRSLAYDGHGQVLASYEIAEDSSNFRRLERLRVEFG